MDPIHPIAPGPPAIAPVSRLPVESLEPITRERDRPSQDAQRRRREPPKPAAERASPSGDASPQGEYARDDNTDGRPHIDVRV